MKRIQVILGIFCILSVGCKSKSREIYTNAHTSGSHQITMSCEKGPYWNENFKLGLLSIKITPQIALWTEDLPGNFIQTLYVTEKFARQQWGGRVSYSADDVFRVEALPLWYYKSGYALSQSNPLPDTLTSASPEGDFSVVSQLDDSHDTIAVFLEVNNSYDYGDIQASEDDQNGQPSILYKVIVNLKEPGDHDMIVVGHSDGRGLSGEIKSDFEDITTALEILSSCSISVQPLTSNK